MSKRAVTGNAADEQQQEDAKRRLGERAAQRRAALQAILRARPGRDYLWELLGDTNLFGSPLGSDALSTYYHLGKQDMGKRLLAEIQQADPTAYLTMMQENANG